MWSSSFSVEPLTKHNRPAFFSSCVLKFVMPVALDNTISFWNLTSKASNPFWQYHPHKDLHNPMKLIKATFFTACLIHFPNFLSIS